MVTIKQRSNENGARILQQCADLNAAKLRLLRAFQAAQKANFGPLWASNAKDAFSMFSMEKGCKVYFFIDAK